ncbi:hypothetical protein OUZ56_018915 [Daphnia magna]|uniref:Uncharacterized protein n=1 Tax=Daphnia magna TaxID=35525 RepID=A0ABQ9ZA39_9CRUS|nr:hypothetical protein OUZ56_018915 [Daphnia magna]
MEILLPCRTNVKMESLSISNRAWSVRSVRSAKMAKKSAGNAGGVRSSFALLIMLIIHVQVTTASWWPTASSTIEITAPHPRDGIGTGYNVTTSASSTLGR